MWSKLNKNRIEKLLQAKLVSPAGLAAIELAKRNGSWNILDTSDELASSNSIPADLEKLFRRNKKARDNFHAFAPSIRKQFLYWIDSAKRPETRAARLQQTVLMSAANKKPGPKGFIF